MAATAAGIVAVDLGAETPDFVDGLARRLHGPVLPAEDAAVPADWRPMLGEATRQIGEWFAGLRRSFDLPIDLRVSDWDRTVLAGAARLHFGETASYGELAGRIGRPGAAQAVGGAMSRNPVPILIPATASAAPTAGSVVTAARPTPTAWPPSPSSVDCSPSKGRRSAIDEAPAVPPPHRWWSWSSICSRAMTIASASDASKPEAIWTP